MSTKYLKDNGHISIYLSHCSNELYDRGFFKSPDGHLVCESCNEIMFAPKSYGPPPGMESLEERRARAKAEAEAREAKLREIEAMRGRKVSR